MSYKAVQMQCPPGGQIIGAGLKGWANNLERRVTDPIFAKYKLTSQDIKDNVWYDGAVLDALWRELYTMPNATQMMVAIGKSGAKAAIDATHPKDFAEWLNNTSGIFDLFIRNVPKEFGWHVTFTGNNEARLWNNTNAPNDYVFGQVWETARLLNAGKQFVVSPVSGYYPGSTEGAVFQLEWE